jgi:hypothetical protein
MGRRAGLIICAALAFFLVAGCGPAKKPTPEKKPASVSALESAFERMGAVQKGRLLVEPVRFTRIARNIEDERWEAALRITSTADVDTLCNVTLRIYNSKREVLQEHIIFNDSIPYMGTVYQADIFFVERKILPSVASTGFEFNCVIREILID